MSQSRTPKLVFKQPEAEGGGDVNLMKEGKIKRKGKIFLSAVSQHSGYYLGSNPPQQNHTQPAEIGTEVRSLQLRGATEGPSFGGLWGPEATDSHRKPHSELLQRSCVSY